MLANADPVRKVSIVARGMMGGYTRVVPDEDRLFKTKAQFEDELAVYMAGHVAEDMVFEEQSTGAANDIERATGMARRMVTEFGMSRTLGPRAFGKKDELIFLGREINEQRNYSDEIAFQIDQEIQELIDAAHERARAIVEGHPDKLTAIAELLLAKETIEGEELEALFESPRPRPDLIGPPTGRPGRATDAARLPEQSADRGERDLPPHGGQLRPQPAD
jgi:cell division protease FtsH